jgi:curli biogenesis system outer membrane secretion channel CsgG
VSIYEFRSTLPNVSSSAATDMFKTALVHSGRFTVLERSRLNEGVVREKQLQQGGFAGGQAGQTQLKGARYLFEGVLSEANASERQRSGGVGVAGLQIGGGSNQESLAIDVRIVDAHSGVVVDAVTVKKALRSESSSVSGVGALLGTVLAQKGRSSVYAPDVNVQQSQREGVDAALRDAINEAVLVLVKRFPS